MSTWVILDTSFYLDKHLLTHLKVKILVSASACICRVVCYETAMSVYFSFDVVFIYGYMYTFYTRLCSVHAFINKCM